MSISPVLVLQICTISPHEMPNKRYDVLLSQNVYRIDRQNIFPAIFTVIHCLLIFSKLSNIWQSQKWYHFYDPSIASFRDYVCSADRNGGDGADPWRLWRGSHKIQCSHSVRYDLIVT